MGFRIRKIDRRKCKQSCDVYKPQEASGAFGELAVNCIKPTP